MPGSANFVGEFLILLGVFNAELAIAIIASTGVALASVYMLRMYIRSMHNREGERVESRELSVRDGLVLVPLVVAIIAFALYPQQALEDAEPKVAQVVAAAAGRVRRRAGGGRAMSLLLAQAGKVEAPPIDWMALSPLVALTGGLCLVLLVGLVRAPFVRFTLVPLLTLLSLAVAGGLAIATWGENESIMSGTLAMDDLTRMLTLLFVVSAAVTVLLSWRGVAVREAGHGEFHCLLAHRPCSAWSCSPARRTS